MYSLFLFLANIFLLRPAETANNAHGAIPLLLPPNPTPPPRSFSNFFASTSMSTPISDSVLDTMLSSLSQYLILLGPLPPGPPPDPPLPASTVSLVSAKERAVGIGNRRGNETVGGFPLYALKGVRIEAVVRFQIWATTPGDVDTQVSELQSRLRVASEELRQAGFLQFDGDTTSLSENISSITAWRRYVDFRVLYEFKYRDTEGADSLVASIPVDMFDDFNNLLLSDDEELKGQPHVMSLSDDMARWDNESAPELEVRGDKRRRLLVRELLILAFLPDLPAPWDGDGVMIEVSVGGTTQPPLHFDSVRALLMADEVTVENEAIVLGGNPYHVGHLAFPNPLFPDPIFLRQLNDFFRVSYDAEAFDPDVDPPDKTEAVVYLRVLR